MAKYCTNCGHIQNSNSTKKRAFSIMPSLSTAEIIQSQVITPNAQAFIFAASVSGVIYGNQPIQFFCGAFLLASFTQTRFYRKLYKEILPEIEQESPQPQETVIKHDILITEEKQNQRVSKRLPLSEKEYKVFSIIAQDIKSGVAFSGSMIAKKLKHVTQNEWSTALELMKRNGHCIKQGNGYALTRGGKVFLNSFLQG